MLEYLPVLLFVIVALGFGAVTIGLSSIIVPMRRNMIKNDPYECGVDPVGNARGRFSVKFYLVAVLFILFDIEAVFLYPWGALFRDLVSPDALGGFAIVEMAAFISVLAITLVYAWKKGALEWEK